ncbi:MAG: DUF1338 domain-containing protein [Bacteroidales bacterium]
MTLEYIFNRLWTEYVDQNPSVGKIYNLFISEGEIVVNDHIAFRTLDYPEINIDVLAQQFVKNGYVPKGEYEFKEKHLFARHYELPGAPRVFISQLILSDCSKYIQKVFGELIESGNHSRFTSEELLFSGAISNPPSYEIFNRLREESEYAGWFYIFGFRANHFTVAINSLAKYDNIYHVNELLKKNGFLLNSAGGEVKGTPEDLLQQSSTMADIVTLKFLEGEFEVPACYYEFAQRFPDSSGQLYSGFISKSADKIFESTNFYKKK